MATKLAVVASLLVAFLALAEASTYTTITTTVFEEDNPRQQRCSEQVQRQQLHQCSTYLTQQGGSSPYELMESVNPEIENEMSRQLSQCCQELRNIDEQCRCEAIRQVVRRQQHGQEGQWQGEKMQRIVQKAESLPQKCNMQQPQQCRIRAVWF